MNELSGKAENAKIREKLRLSGLIESRINYYALVEGGFPPFLRPPDIWLIHTSEDKFRWSDILPGKVLLPSELTTKEMTEFFTEVDEYGEIRPRRNFTSEAITPTQTRSSSAEYRARCLVRDQCHFARQEGASKTYLTTGQATVYFDVPTDEKSTAYFYFLCYDDALASASPGLEYRSSEVGCHLAMTLLALRHPSRLVQALSKTPRSVHRQGPETAEECTEECTKEDTGEYTEEEFTEEDTDEHMRYCTEECLGSLLTNSPMDETCPNLQYHRQNTTGPLHDLTIHPCRSKVKSQLETHGSIRNLHIISQHSSSCAHKLILKDYKYVFTV